MRKAFSVTGQDKVDAVLTYHKTFVQESVKSEFGARINDRIYRTMSPVFGSTVDAKARLSPLAYHHVYEWEKTGDRGSRLFDLTKAASGHTMSLSYQFRDSKIGVGDGDSRYVFANKAEVMENKIPVVIRPRRGRNLRFEIDGEIVYTPGPVHIPNPGGKEVYRTFSNTFRAFWSEANLNANAAYNGIFKAIESRTAFELDRVPGSPTSAAAQARSVAYMVTG